MPKTKPISWSWRYFKREEDPKGKIVGFFIFCDQQYVDNATRQEAHLKNCNKVGAEARKQIDHLSKKPAVRRSRSLSPESKKTKLSESVILQGSTGSIKHFFDSTSKEDQEELDILLTRAIATGNIAPNILDNPFFKQFVAKLKPSYKLPNRQQKFAKALIPAEFNRVKQALEDSCNKADFLAISSDGWTDVRSNSIINVVVHTPKPFLYDSIDATAVEVTGDLERIQHTGDFIAEVLSEQINKLGKHKIVAVVTDHAANMRNAWKKLALEFPWILFEGCKAHAVDLAAKDICKKTKIAECLKYCVEVAKFFRKKTPELILSKAQVEQSGSSLILQLPVQTRWGTWSRLVSSIMSSEVALKSAICAPGILKDATLKREAERLRKMLLESEDFWLDVKDCRKVLSPLADAITGIEGNKVNSRRSYRIIRDAFAKSKAAVEESCWFYDLKDELKEILRVRQEFAKSDVAHLLELLEPSQRAQSLTDEEKQRAIDLLANKCLKNPVFAGREQEVLAEWASWLAGTGVFALDNRRYAWDAVNSMDAFTWWKAFFSGTLLSKIVQMIHNVPVSASSTERNWSLRGGIHTKLRNRMKVATASQVTFIKHNLLLEFGHLFKGRQGEKAVESEEQLEEEDLQEICDENDLFSFD